MLKLGKYQYYKGKNCEVIGTAKHSETNEKLVIYKNCEDSIISGKDELRARPYELFIEVIEVDGKQIPRFEFIGN